MEFLPLGIGIKSYKQDKKAYLKCLWEQFNLENVVKEHISKIWSWDDIIIERLKYGRGSAIKGQHRGRLLEDELERVIAEVFGGNYKRGCNFEGLDGRTAKAEFAIPCKEDPAIIFEAKAYGATGSKQTDVAGDIQKMIDVKKPATDFLFATDGMTWKQRLSDLRKIIDFQNKGYIRKIYTLDMMDELKEDLISLKNDHNL